MIRRLILAGLIALFPALASAQFAIIGPTQPTADNGDRLATTAWVNNFVNAGLPLAPGKIWIGSAGSIATAQTPSGDWTISNAGLATLATVNGNVGTFGSATQCITTTQNAKGLTTAISAATCTPAIGSITGLGTGVATALGNAVTGSGGAVLATAPTIDNATLSTRLNKGVYIVCMTAVTGMTITGTLTETTLATCAVPGNAMGTNGALRITAQYSKTGVAGTMEPRLKFGGTTFMDNGAAGATVLSGRLQTEIHNRNATNSQIGTSIGQANWAVQATTASIATALDTTTSQNVTFTCQLGNVGDTCELSSYTVEVLSP